MARRPAFVSAANRVVTPARARALAGLALWYEDRLARGVTVYVRDQDLEPGRAVPPEYLRPSGMIGGSESVMYGSVTAGGVEARRNAGPDTGTPFGAGSRVEVVQAEEHDRLRAQQAARADVLALVEQAMLRLGLIDPFYPMVVEARMARFSWDMITSRLEVSRPTAIQWFECGVTWVAGYLIIRPNFRDRLAPLGVPEDPPGG